MKLLDPDAPEPREPPSPETIRGRNSPMVAVAPPNDLGSARAILTEHCIAMLTSVPGRDDGNDAAFANVYDQLVEHVFAIMSLVGREPDASEATYRALIEIWRTATRSTTPRGSARPGFVNTAGAVKPDMPAIDLPVEMSDAVGWPGREEGLSKREGEILVFVAQGRTNAEITELVYLSANSIKSYIRSAYRKIGVTTRVEAVLWGVDHNLRPVPGDDGLPASACLSPSCL